MKTPPKKSTDSWQPPEECPACEAQGSFKTEPATTIQVFRGETLNVPCHHWKCSTCGFSLFSPSQIDGLTSATIAAYQRSKGLLTAEDLKTARANRGWNQERLAEEAGLGLATIKRLEAGMTVQTPSNDRALRLSLDWALGGEFSVMWQETFHADVADECDFPPSCKDGPPAFPVKTVSATKAAPAQSAAAFAFKYSNHALPNPTEAASLHLGSR